MPFRLAVTIAGAVSLGSFEAGVLFEVLDALAQHNGAAPEDARIHIDVLTGASAGGMTSAMAAQNLLYSAEGLAQPYGNVFYDAWVASVDIDGLLPLASDEPADQSVLSSNFVRSLAQKFLLARYQQTPIPAQNPHAAVDPSRSLQVGLALSNLNGVDYERPLLSGGQFNYTRFEDQIVFPLSSVTDVSAAWNPVVDAALACGAFPFAFRPCELSRETKDYANSPFLAPWPASPRDFLYTDGGVFQNQPLGLAKNLVDTIDNHQNSDSRFYLFVSPAAVDPKASSVSDGATFKAMTGALLNSVYNQAGFQDWIDAETVNDAVNLLNQRAGQLLALLKNGAVQAAAIESVTNALLPQFRPDAAKLQAARGQLRSQFAEEYAGLSGAMGTPAADAWIDAILLLELAADLHEKDEMYIYSVTADRKDLAGAGFSSFLGFLDRSFRDHDYDLGRQKAQSFLTSLHQESRGRLPQLLYTPKPIHPIQPTPAGGFTPDMIPKDKRETLYKALSSAADNFLKQEGVSIVIRKAAELFYMDGQIKKMLGL